MRPSNETTLETTAPKADLVKLLTVTLQRSPQQITTTIQLQTPNATMHTTLFPPKTKLNALPVRKPTQNGRLTPYHLKPFVITKDTKQYLATIEAVGAHLSALVFGVEFSPKVRVVAENPQEQKPKILSKTVEGYKPAFPLPDHIQFDLMKKNQRDMAKLFLKILCFAEPDLHAGGNWGIDQATGKVANIDHGRAFGSFSMEFSSEEEQTDCETEPEVLKRYPNLVYTSDEILNIISADDIHSMPLFDDLRPYNTPFNPTKSGYLQHLKALQKDSEFIQWKFFYLTKYLLLLTPERIKTIIRGHSIAEDELDNRFCNIILNRQKMIRETLLTMPDYQAFLAKNMLQLWNALRQEIDKYNSLFCSKNNIPKPHKQHYLILLRMVSTELRGLQQEACAALTSDTAEKKRMQTIALDIARIKREITAFYNYSRAVRDNTSRWRDAECMLNHTLSSKKYSALDSFEKKQVLNFLVTHNFIQKTFEDFLQYEKDKPLRDFFHFILDSRIVMQGRQEYSIRYFFGQVKVLFMDYGSALSKNQLSDIWNTIQEKDLTNKNNMLLLCCEHCPLENTPAIMREWLLQNIDEMQKINSFQAENPVFASLQQLMHAVKQNTTDNNLYRFFSRAIYKPPIRIASETLLNILLSSNLSKSFSPEEYAACCAALSHASLLEINTTGLCRHDHVPEEGSILVTLRYQNGKFALTSCVILNTPTQEATSAQSRH